MSCDFAPGHSDCSSASQTKPTSAVSSLTKRPSPERSGRLFNDSWSSEAQQRGPTSAAWCASFWAGDHHSPSLWQLWAHEEDRQSGATERRSRS